MVDQPLFPRTAALGNTMRLLSRFMNDSPWARRRFEPDIADFTFGNPHEMALPRYVDALRRALPPQDADWFAYKSSEPESCAIVAASLRESVGIPFEAKDIAMTTGGFGALAAALKAVTEPGDEVVYSLPPWFLYEIMILDNGLIPVKINVDPVTFDLDLDAIKAAITPRTRVLIVNTPHNPTGKIYPPETLTRLAALLDDASRRNGRTIYLLSDEPYNRIVFAGARFHSPTAFYPNTLLAYSYGKVLLTPGQRIGYLALPPTMPDRDQVMQSIVLAQIACGYLFPNALLQHALADLDALSIDIPHLERKRDRMISALREMGYAVHVPEGTFYLLPHAPWEDDLAFTALLAEYGVFVLPGSIAEIPGHFRISLTASDAMIERSLPGFAAAIKRANKGAPLTQEAIRSL